MSETQSEELVSNIDELILALDLFIACIEMKLLPGINSPCHKRMKMGLKKVGR